jgi:hypothetical protein
LFVEFFQFLSKGSTACIPTSKMSNMQVWSNSKDILDITDESDSETESIFSGASSNYEPEDSETKDEKPNNSDDDTDDETNNNLPSAGGWSKYNSQLDFVKHSEKCEK